MSNTKAESREALDLQGASVLIFCDSGYYDRYLLGKKRTPGKWRLDEEKKTITVTLDDKGGGHVYHFARSGNQIVKLTVDAGTEFGLIATGELGPESLPSASVSKEVGR